MANPVEEMAILRESMLGSHQQVALTPGETLAVFNSSVSTSFDLNASLALSSQSTMAMLAVMAASTTDAHVLLSINVSATGADGLRVVNMSATVPYATTANLNVTTSFMLPDADEMLVRVLADHSIVEIFAGSGRGVVTTGVLNPGDSQARANVFVSPVGDSNITVSASAWAMGCGWA